MNRESPKATPSRPAWVKPKFQGITQHSLRKFTKPCQIMVNGLAVEVEAGTLVSITAGGNGVTGTASFGRLMHDMNVMCLDGKTRCVHSGATIEVPN